MSPVKHENERAGVPDDGAPAAAATSPLFDGVPTDDLRAEAEQMAAEVVRRGLATDAELALHRPGGDKNLDTGPRGWLRLFAVAHRFHARGERPGGAAAAANTTADDALVMKAFTREPVRVRLFTDPDVELFVHPKGLEAQLQIHALDVRLAWESSHIQWLKELATPPAMEVLPHALDCLAYSQQLLAWIVTSEGPEMPYRVTDPHPEPPEHIRRLEGLDFVQINQKCQSLALRQKAITSLVDARAVSEGGKRINWSQLIAILAADTGVDTLTLTRHRTLDELIAAVRLDADARAPREKDGG